MHTVIDDYRVRVVDGGITLASMTFAPLPTAQDYARAAVLCDLMQSRQDLRGERYVVLDDVVTAGMASNTGTYYRVMKRAKELRGRL